MAEMRNSYSLYVLALVWACFSYGYTTENIRVGDYGVITDRSIDVIKDATVERVIFYPQSDPLFNKKIERSGYLVRYKDAVGTILICHGFMCDKYDTGFLRRLFPRGRYNIMSFDFRAHGENKANQICTLGRDEAYDVIAAAQFLKNHPQLKGLPLYAYGFSMGAVAAIEAQAKEKSLFSAMVLDCPFDSAENIIKRGLEHLKVSLWGYTFGLPGRSLLQRYAFHPYVQSMLRVILKTVANMDSRDVAMRVFPIDPVKTIAGVSVPLFFIHCKNDKKVSVEAIKSVYNNAASDYKVLWITNGRTHFDSFFYNPEKYTEKVREFLEKAASGKLGSRQEIIEDRDDQIII